MSKFFGYPGTCIASMASTVAKTRAAVRFKGCSVVSFEFLLLFFFNFSHILPYIYIARKFAKRCLVFKKIFIFLFSRFFS